MALGGIGKYDDIATELRHKLQAEALMLCVMDGIRGHGFSIQCRPGMAALLPAILRTVADTIERELANATPEEIDKNIIREPGYPSAN